MDASRPITYRCSQKSSSGDTRGYISTSAGSSIKTEPMLRGFLAAILLTFWPSQPGAAQLLTDTLFTWQGYGRASTCRIRIYESAPDQKRSRTIVVDELAENQGASTLDDVQHLAELVGRTLAQDPEDAFWIFRWGAFSYPGADKHSKEVYFRATFSRSGRGALGTPFWRLVDRETVVEYTDRAFH